MLNSMIFIRLCPEASGLELSKILVLDKEQQQPDQLPNSRQTLKLLRL